MARVGRTFLIILLLAVGFMATALGTGLVADSGANRPAFRAKSTTVPTQIDQRSGQIDQ